MAMAKKQGQTPLAEVRIAATRPKTEGEGLVARMRRIALVKHGRAKALKDVLAMRRC